MILRLEVAPKMLASTHALNKHFGTTSSQESLPSKVNKVIRSDKHEDFIL